MQKDFLQMRFDLMQFPYFCSPIHIYGHRAVYKIQAPEVSYFSIRKGEGPQRPNGGRTEGMPTTEHKTLLKTLPKHNLHLLQELAPQR